MAKTEFNLNPDGSLDLKQDLGTLFDDVLDEVHSRGGGDASAQPHTIDRERFERDAAEFLDALHLSVRAALRSDGVAVTGVELTADETGFRIAAHDAQHKHRDYSVCITLDRALALSQGTFGKGPLDAITGEVTAGIRAARAKYAARML